MAGMTIATRDGEQDAEDEKDRPKLDHRLETSGQVRLVAATNEAWTPQRGPARLVPTIIEGR